MYDETMKHVIENKKSEEIIAICANAELANHFAKFLPFETKVCPITDYDFCYNKIRDFEKQS